MNRQLTLAQFAVEVPRWYEKYAQSNPKYFPLEERISGKAIEQGCLTMGDVVEIVKWGSKRLGPRLSARIGRHNKDSDIEAKTGAAVRVLNNPEGLALRRLLGGKYGGIYGLGLAFATKTLRCLCPQNYGVLDSKLRQAIDASLLPNIRNEIDLYLHFLELLRELKQMASPPGPSRRPNREWFIADVEMALFQFAWYPGHRLVRS